MTKDLALVDEKKWDVETCLKGVSDQFRFESKHWLTYAQEHSLHPLDPKCWESFINSLYKPQPLGSGRMEGISYGTESIMKRITAIRERVRYMIVDLPIEEQRRILSELARIKKPPKAEKEEHRYLLPEGIKALIDGTDERLSLMIRFLFTTALRVSEMTGLVHKSIERTNGHYGVPFYGKGNKKAIVHFSRGMYEEIKRVYQGRIFLFETERRKPYHRSAISMNIKRAARRILDTDFSVHGIRHSAAMHCFDVTKDILQVSKFLRHSSPQITIAAYLSTRWTWDVQQEVMADFDIPNHIPNEEVTR